MHVLQLYILSQLVRKWFGWVVIDIECKNISVSDVTRGNIVLAFPETLMGSKIHQNKTWQISSAKLYIKYLQLSLIVLLKLVISIYVLRH